MALLALVINMLELRIGGVKLVNSCKALFLSARPARTALWSCLKGNLTWFFYRCGYLGREFFDGWRPYVCGCVMFFQTEALGRTSTLYFFLSKTYLRASTLLDQWAQWLAHVVYPYSSYQVHCHQHPVLKMDWWKLIRYKEWFLLDRMFLFSPQVQVLEFLAYLGLVINLLLCSLRHSAHNL